MRRPLLILLALLCTQVQAQVGISGLIQTDTVSMLMESAAVVHPPKTTAALMAASALIPGTGQFIGGQPKRALAFFAIDAALVAGAIFTLRQSHETNLDARSYARTYARTGSSRSEGDSYWKDIGTYISNKGWNADMERMEQLDKEYNAVSDQWAWDSDASMSHYNVLRTDAEAFRIAGSFMLAGLLLDRAFCLLDLRIGLRRGTIAAAPSFDLSKGNAGMGIVARF